VAAASFNPFIAATPTLPILHIRLCFANGFLLNLIPAALEGS